MKDPNSGQTSGYHFFLTISEPLISELNRTITELAEKMHSSAFVAHCTLIAEIPDAPGLSEEMILEQAKRLAATTRPLTLTLDTVEIEDTFFRALTIRPAPSVALDALHTQARELFSMQDPRPYQPHVSLLYGTFSTEEKRQVSTTLVLPLGRTFVAESLQVFKTHGSVDQWELKGTFQFQK
jgi:2'-5' RNA ligase